MFKGVRSIILGVLSLFFFVTASFAWEWVDDIVEDLEENLEQGSVLGIGVVMADRAYEDVDDYIYPVPLAVLEYERFFIDQSLIGFHLLDEEELKFSVVGTPRFEGYSSEDSTILNGMDDREWGFDAGVRGQWKPEVCTLILTGLMDVSGKSKGQEVSAVISKEFFEGALKPRLGVIWLSEDLVDYYYGVQGHEATGARPAYEPDATLNYIAGVTIGVPLSEKWALIGDIHYQILGDEIQDSPIVDKDGLFRYVVGAVYRF